MDTNTYSDFAIQDVGNVTHC